ncbi:MAG: hypothetical protein R3B82_11105 [Sandaracinaceae bacterium]
MRSVEAAGVYTRIEATLAAAEGQPHEVSVDRVTAGIDAWRHALPASLRERIIVALREAREGLYGRDGARFAHELLVEVLEQIASEIADAQAMPEPGVEPPPAPTVDDDEEDLRLAVALGLFILGTVGTPGGVQLEAPLLRYDPTLPPSERARLVCAALREHARNKGAAVQTSPAPFDHELARTTSDVAAALGKARPWALRIWSTVVGLAHVDRWRVVLGALRAVEHTVPGLPAALAPVTGPLTRPIAEAVLAVDHGGRDVELVRDGLLAGYVERSSLAVAIAEVVSSLAAALEAEDLPAAPVLERFTTEVERAAELEGQLLPLRGAEAHLLAEAAE